MEDVRNITPCILNIQYLGYWQAKRDPERLCVWEPAGGRSSSGHRAVLAGILFNFVIIDSPQPQPLRNQSSMLMMGRVVCGMFQLGGQKPAISGSLGGKW